jgi:hypothetical protein
MRKNSSTVLQLYSSTALQLYSSTALQLYSSTALQLYSSTALQLYSSTALTGIVNEEEEPYMKPTPLFTDVFEVLLENDVTVLL